MGKTLRNIVAGIMIPVAVAGSSYLSGCEEKPVSAQNQVQVQKVEQQRVAEVKESKEAFEEKFPVALEIQVLTYGREDPIGNRLIVIGNNGNGVYGGKMSRVVGSQEAEICYDKKSRTSSVKLKIDQLIGYDLYTYEQKGYMGLGNRYIAKSKNGKEKRFAIVSNPFAEEPSLGEVLNKLPLIKF